MTNRSQCSKLHVRRSFIASGLVLACLAAAAPVEAGQHRARLSRDLSERLAGRGGAATDIIVSGTDDEVQTIATRYGARVKKRLQGRVVLEVTAGQLQDLSQDSDVAAVSGDVPVRAMASVSAEAIGADQVWEGVSRGMRGFTGRGIGVAIIDTGIDARHPALRGRVVLSLDFTSARRNRNRDENGHGTHIAGIVRDIAPGAHSISLRAMGADGSGQTSSVLEAFDWAIEHRREWNIKIINVSLGHPVMESERDDPLCQAVRRATDAGILVTVAAGNAGKTLEGTPIVGGIFSPGNSPYALTVGAINTQQTVIRSDDVMATYSSRGPTLIDGVLKPELVAPGSKIVGPVPGSAYLPTLLPERVTGAEAETYMALSGTGLAAAAAAGAAALVLESRNLSPAETKLVLQFTSSRVAGAGLIEAGAGSLNVVAAVGVARGKRRYMRVTAPSAMSRNVPRFIAYRNDDSGTGLVSIGSPARRSSGPIFSRRSMPSSPPVAWTNSIVWTNSVLQRRRCQRIRIHRLDEQHRLDQPDRLDQLDSLDQQRSCGPTPSSGPTRLSGRTRSAGPPGPMSHSLAAGLLKLLRHFTGACRSTHIRLLPLEEPMRIIVWTD